MTTRYGDKTEIGNPVTNWGRGAPTGGGGVLQPYEQVFTAPGTWTNPGTVTRVDVLLVGGGGGGGGARFAQPAVSPASPTFASPRGIFGGGGGGGGVRLVEGHPVVGPVPVTVGAGGTAGAATEPTIGGTGGSSSFGPLTVGGGGGGGGLAPTSFPSIPTIPGPPTNVNYFPAQNGGNAPPDGGGGGGVAQVTQQRPGFPGPQTVWLFGKAGTGGAYGTPGQEQSFNSRQGGSSGGGAGLLTTTGRNNLWFTSSTGRWIYGAGGVGQAESGRKYASFGPQVFDANPSGTPAPGVAGTPGLANTGMGGAGGAQTAGQPTGVTGGTGGSGVVIVRWWA